jgi:Uma2 family endonuclease
MLAGGSPYHSAIIANLAATLDRSLGDSPCWIYNSDVQLQLSETRYVHPDVAVSCNESDHEAEDAIRYPCLVIEVLSPSTEAVDRIKKLAYYRECPSIQEYVMVDSQSIHVEVYHREDGKWMLSTYGPDSIITLESLNIEFSIKDIYRRMNLTGTRKNRKG